MTTPPPLARSRRRLWLILAGVVVLVVLAVVLLLPRLTRHVAPTPTASTGGPTSSPTAGAIPSGCAGGSQRDAAMILGAQKAAPHTSAGAVEVAAAFVRWTFRHPTPSVDEANEVAPSIIASTATDNFKNLAQAFAANPNPSGGAVADGTDFYVSTGPGVWYLDATSADEVTTSVGAGYVVDGTLNPSLRSSSTFTLVWESGAWRVKSGSIRHTTEQLFQIGRSFDGGC